MATWREDEADDGDQRSTYRDRVDLYTVHCGYCCTIREVSRR